MSYNSHAMREIEGQGQPGMNVETIDPEGTKVIVIRSLEEIEALENPEEIEVVHLTRNKAVAITAVEKLTELCPNLTDVHVLPCLLKKRLSKKARIILEEKSIELQIINTLYIHLLPGTELIESIDDINELRNPNKVKIAHLSSPEAVKINTIKELLEICPNLTIVSVAPSIAERVLSLTAKEFLAEKNIELQIKRYRDAPYYVCQSPTIRRNYLTKKEIYEDFFMNPEKKEQHQLLFLLSEHGFDVKEMVEMYFGEEAMSIRDIARKTGIRYLEVDRDIAALLHLIGYPSSNMNVLRRSREWLRKLNKKAEKNAWRENYPVGKTKPPKRLSQTRWKMWQKIMQFRKDNPGEWSYFKKNFRRHHEILVKFFQLDGFRGEIITLEQMAKKLGITEGGVGYLKKTALKNLGLLESEE